MPRNERVGPQGEWTVAARAAALLALVAGAAVSSAQVGLNDLLDSATGTPAAEQAGNNDAGSAKDLSDQVSVNEHFLVDLHVNDEDLANVLQMLSIQSQRNIVASKDVSASVTANLYGVTFFEALDAILNVNGYGYVERGNFIYVYTLAELAQIEQASRQREARVIKLNYLNATDAAAFVAPMLSDGGSITTNGRTAAFSIPQDAPTGADEYVHDGTLVVFDYPDRVDEIFSLVAQLDTRPQQVLVEATILQSSLNEANAFGVDFSLIADLNFGDFLGPLDATNTLLSGRGNRVDGGEVQSPSDNVGFAATGTPGNVANGEATFRTGVIAEDLAVFLRLLDSVSDTTILSNPKILSLNRQPSRVLVGRKVGYLSTTNTETASTQTVEFLDTGTQLYFRPFVTQDGFIRMELKPQVSEAVIRDVTDASGAAVTIPDEITNELTTNVMVRDGQTIVLGGLFREATTAERRQVPIVGDIPIIGAAFRGYDDETTRSEIIFMITPSIVSDDMLLAEGEDASNYIEDVRAGSRMGVLPFSRERQSQQLQVEAERLAATGDVNRALHKIRRSLELKPNQPNAIRLQERLLNREAIWPSQSLLEDIYNNEVENREMRLRSVEPGFPPTPFSGGKISMDDAIVPQGNAYASGVSADSAQPAAPINHVDPLFASSDRVESWPAPAGTSYVGSANFSASPSAMSVSPEFEPFVHSGRTFSKHQDSTHPFVSSVNPYIQFAEPPVAQQSVSQRGFFDGGAEPSFFEQNSIDQNTPEAFDPFRSSEPVANVEVEEISSATQPGFSPATNSVNNSVVNPVTNTVASDQSNLPPAYEPTPWIEPGAVTEPTLVDTTIPAAPAVWTETEGMAPPPPVANTLAGVGPVQTQVPAKDFGDIGLEQSTRTRALVRLFEGFDDFADTFEDESAPDAGTSITNVPTESDQK